MLMNNNLWFPITYLKRAPEVYMNTLWCSFGYDDLRFRLMCHEKYVEVEKECSVPYDVVDGRVLAINFCHTSPLRQFSIEKYDMISCISYECFDYISNYDYISFYEGIKKFHALISAYNRTNVCSKYDIDCVSFAPIDNLMFIFLKDKHPILGNIIML